MVRQKYIFLIAILASLGIHLASMGLFVGYARWAGWSTRYQTRSANGKLQRPAETQPEEELIVYPDMGDAQGTGIGSNSSPGDQPQVAREADEDQALLSRNPQGAGRTTAKPTNQRGLAGDGQGGTPAKSIAAPMPKPQIANGSAATPAPDQPAKPPESAAPPQPAPTPAVVLISPAPEPKTAPPLAPVVKQTPIASAIQQPDEDPHPEVPSAAGQKVQVAVVLPPPQGPKVSPTESDTRTDEAEPTKPVQEARGAPKEDGAASAKPQAAQNGDGRRTGVPPPPGNPLPQSDSESDPFSRISGDIAIPRVGRLDVRMGRKVKTTRPQVNIGGQIDLIALNNPTVVLEVHIRPDGSVADVKVAHSSGSNAIDEPTRVAIYEWWFEPAHDKSGKPVADVIFFTVKYL